MKKHISILIVFIMVFSAISICVSAAENVEYYPECPLLPTYESLGYWSSREILDKGDGRRAYIMSIYKPDVYAVEYEQRLKSEFGWTEVSSTNSYNTNYKVFKNEDYYVGIAIVYNSSSADNIRIYPNLEDPNDTTDPYLAYLHKWPSTQTAKNENDEEISVVLNGKRLSFDVEPVVNNGRTLVPFRKIFEEFGYKVDWDEEDQIACGYNNEKNIYYIGFTINHPYVYYHEHGKDMESKELDVAPMVINGRTMIPLRALSESLGAIVNWDDKTSTVTISYYPESNKNNDDYKYDNKQNNTKQKDAYKTLKEKIIANNDYEDGVYQYWYTYGTDIAKARTKLSYEAEDDYFIIDVYFITETNLPDKYSIVIPSSLDRALSIYQSMDNFYEYKAELSDKEWTEVSCTFPDAQREKAKYLQNDLLDLINSTMYLEFGVNLEDMGMLVHYDTTYKSTRNNT